MDFCARTAPLLFVAGDRDHIVPPGVNRRNERRYARRDAETDLHTHGGRTHWILAQPEREIVAADAIEWMEIKTGG